jgi:hypothetical protein
MIDVQASLDQQFLDITIGKGIAKVPTDGTENDLGGKVPPFEACGSLWVCHTLSSVAGPIPDFCNRSARSMAETFTAPELIPRRPERTPATNIRLNPAGT